MQLSASTHSSLEARFLGITIPANTDGVTALRLALDTLFLHPNVGPFFGEQLIQRLITSNPSPAYIARVSAVFNNNGQGVRGDMRADYSTELALASDASALVEHCNLVLCAGQMSASTTTIRDAINTINASTTTGRQNRVNAAILMSMSMSSADYLVQR